jgi:hypothetical protein
MPMPHRKRAPPTVDHTIVDWLNQAGRNVDFSPLRGDDPPEANGYGQAA